MACFICANPIEGAAADYWRCPGCGHERSRADIGTGMVTNDSLDEAKLSRPDGLVRAQCALVKGLMKANDLLIDIGCGSGRFLFNAAKRFKRAIGIEVDPDSAAFARRVFHLSVEETLPDRLPVPSVVTFWHSLEHIPAAQIERYLGMLEKSGDANSRVLVCVPNASSFQYEIFGTSYAYYDFPAHLHQFTARSLDILMTKFGFVRDGRTLMPRYSAFGWAQGLLNKIIPSHNYLYYRMKRGRSSGLGRGHQWLYDALSVVLLAGVLPIAAALTAVEYFFPERQGVITAWYRKAH